MNKFFPTGVVVAVLLMLAMPMVPHALASPSTVTFTVDTVADRLDDDTSDGVCHTSANTCSLRAAIMQANKMAGPGVTIILPAGAYTLTRPPAGSNDDYNGDLNLTTPASGNPVISVIGAGATSTIIDANQIDRVFRIEAGRTTIITGVAIRNGYSPNAGGGIYNIGALTVSNSMIFGNRAIAGGGGLYNVGTLSVSQSTVSGNRSDSNGGGIRNEGIVSVSQSTISGNRSDSLGGGILNDSTLNVSNSTIYGNHAYHGGGLFNDGSLIAINSTISQNDADADGGGIYNIFGTANVYNTSIVFNGADADRDGGSGGGVYNSSSQATFNLRNTLVAGNNVANTPVYDDCSGTLNSYGRNVFWTPSSCTVVNVGNSSYKTLNSLDTLGPLQNNGGPTWTHALLLGSNAIDGADPAAGCVDSDSIPLFTDQRGAARVVGVRCDVGAFEYNPLRYRYLPLIRR